MFLMLPEKIYENPFYEDENDNQLINELIKKKKKMKMCILKAFLKEKMKKKYIR